MMVKLGEQRGQTLIARAKPTCARSGVKDAVPLDGYVGHISSFFFHFHGYGSMLLMGLLDLRGVRVKDFHIK